MGFKKPRNYSLFSAKVRANGPKLSPTCWGQAQPPPTTGPAAGGRPSLRSKNNDATKQGLMAQ